MAKRLLDFFSAKVGKEQTVLAYRIELLHDLQKLAKIGMPFIRIFDITGGIYFNNFALHRTKKD